MQLYEAGRVMAFTLNEAVSLEDRWVPNPNYLPQLAGGEEERGSMELPYIQEAVTEVLYDKVLVLHALWKAGIVPDAYTEARLDELSDFCSRNGSIQIDRRRGRVPELRYDEGFDFGAQLAKVMSEKGISRAELAKRVGITIGTVVDLESSKREPRLSTVRTLAEALEVDLGEFLHR